MPRAKIGVKLKTLASAAVIASLLFLLAPSASARGSPALTEGSVTPENRPWGSTFTFEVAYTDTDNENNLPSVGPKLYIDNKIVENAMVEKDPADNDVTDGKIYRYEWVTTAENIGAHDFYFYVEGLSGENARDPSTDTYDGPIVNRRSVLLSCEVDNPEPYFSQPIAFTGRFLDATNQGIPNRTVTLYSNGQNTGLENLTDAQGNYSIHATAPDILGQYVYYTYFAGDNQYFENRSPDVAVTVTRRPTTLTCEVDNPEPATGETVTFSGYLRMTEENLGTENLILYKLLLDGGVEVSSTTTDDNGHFSLSLDAPGPGIFCYKVRFLGDNIYENSESSILYVNTLEKPLVFGVYAVFLLALVGVMMFLLPRGIARAHYLGPVLLGFVLGFFLLFMGAGDLGILAAGAITGYLFARETREWTKHLRIGCMTGLLFLLVSGFLSAYLLMELPKLGLEYSITQTEVFEILFYGAIFYLVYYTLLVGLGAVLGGMLRKLLKPAEQKLSGSGVGQEIRKTWSPRSMECPPVVENHGQSS